MTRTIEVGTATAWPALPADEWQPTISTLHMWLQIVGKVRLALAPPLNHWWHVPLYVTPRGLTTSAIPYQSRAFQIDVDFVDHCLIVTDGSATPFSMTLEPRSVAQFYRDFMSGLGSRGIAVSIWPHPVEIVEAIPFEEDEQHASYDPTHAELLWQALVQAERVFQAFRTGFIGKASPVHFFWGGFDLATTRFSGRTAPRHGGGIPNCADWVMQEAESHENYCVGLWPLSGSAGPAFYAYAYPEPPGFRTAKVGPADAYYDEGQGEFLLSYEAVRTSSDPDAALREFLQSAYVASADLAGWDRRALEPVEQPQRHPTRAWSIGS